MNFQENNAIHRHTLSGPTLYRNSECRERQLPALELLGDTERSKDYQRTGWGHRENQLTGNEIALKDKTQDPWVVLSNMPGA